MTQTELAADILHRNVEMVKMTLADFSDADMLVRPVPSANHAAWQVGHVLASQVQMGGGALPALPAGFAEKFTKAASKTDAPGAFPDKAVLIKQLDQTTAATVAWIKTLTPADLEKKGPAPIIDFCPTMGHLVSLMGGHWLMHMGQFQVIRRKLGKPVLF